MELNDLKSQWGDMTKGLNEQAPNVSQNKALNRPKALQKLADMNLIELLFNFASVPCYFFLIVFTDVLDGFPIAIQIFSLLWSIGFIVPSFLIFLQLQRPGHHLPTVVFLQRLVRLINWFKRLQILGNGLLTFALIIIGGLFYRPGNFKFTFNEVPYDRLIDVPDDYFWMFFGIYSGVAFVFSLLGALWGFLLYLIFYHYRRKEIKGILKQFQTDEN